MSNTTVAKLFVFAAPVLFACACGSNGGGSTTSTTSPPASNPALTPASNDQAQVAAIISQAFIAGLQLTLPAIFPAEQTSHPDARLNSQLVQPAEASAQAAETGSVQISYGLDSLPSTPINETIPLTGTGVVFGAPFGCDFTIGGNVVVSWTPGMGGTATATENLQTTILSCGDGATGGPPLPTYPTTYFQSWGIPISGLQVTCTLAISPSGVVEPAEECALSGSITFYNPNPCEALPQNQDTPACTDFVTEPVSLTYTFTDFPSQPPTASGNMGTSMNASLPSVTAPTTTFTTPPSPLSVSLSPPMNVQSCVPGSSSGESISLQGVQVDSNGNINSGWYVQNGAMTPTIQVTGNATASTFSATLTCTNGGGSGSISAAGTHYNYTGTYNLNTQ